MYHYIDGLQSQRLSTRFLMRDDIDRWAPFFDDPDSVAFLPDYGITDSHARATQWIERQLMRYENQLYGLHALIDHSTGTFIGQCGLITQEIEDKTEIEVGYHILHPHRGQGYAPEAARLFIDFAFDNHQCDSVISMIDVRNTNSQRVAEKNGLQRERCIVWKGLDIYIYRIYSDR
jgi:RimJ/RimL family protein N-acetyltransferase